MPFKGGTHLIDTDVLEHIRYRPDSQQIYDGIVALAAAGTLKTVRQVFGELKKHKTPFGVLKPHEKVLTVDAGVQFCDDVKQRMGLVQQHAGFLWAATGGKNPDPADPWLIAVAAAHGFSVVTNENKMSPNRIPAACKKPQIGVNCISGAEFLLGVGLVQEIKPEHVSAHEFFNINSAAAK